MRAPDLDEIREFDTATENVLTVLNIKFVIGLIEGTIKAKVLDPELRIPPTVI